MRAHVIAGLVGGLAGSFAMEHFQRALGKISPDIGGAPGGGGQQHRKPQSEPSTYKAADAVACATTGRPVPAPYKPAAGSLVHYAFGGTLGAIYGAATWHNRDVGAGGGLPFGAVVWIAADEIGMPVVGLAKAPTSYPLKDHASAFTAHLVYGATTEAVRRLVLAALGPRRRAGSRRPHEFCR